MQGHAAGTGAGKGKQDLQLCSDVSDGADGHQIKMRITRQIHPWQSSCSQASGLQDSQICVYLSNGKTYKTPPQRAPRHRSCSGERPHSFPCPQTCPHPRLQLLMEFAIRFKEDSNLTNSYRSPIDRGSGISMHREDSPVSPWIITEHPGIPCMSFNSPGKQRLPSKKVRT